MSDYLRQKWAELDARKAAAEREAAGLPPLVPVDAAVAPAAVVAPPEPRRAADPGHDAQRTARRRAVEAAIDRGEEPAGDMRPVASHLSPQAQRAAGMRRVNRTRIHEADLPAKIDRATDVPELYRRVLAAATPHKKGDPWLGTLMRYAYAQVELERNRGYGRATLKLIAGIAKFCTRSASRCADWFELHGLADIGHTPHQDREGYWRRGANVTVLTVDVEPAPPPADVDAPASPPVARLGGKYRLAALFGLVVRPWGLNKNAAWRDPWRSRAPA